MPGPTTATIKRLFAVSGNECAFPGCELPLVDPDNGTVLGEICHIKARSPDGPRYDPNQTEKERHAFENLLLLCPSHHKVIDDNSEEYTAERLHEIKREHEGRHAGGREPSDIIARQFLEPLSARDLLDACQAQVQSVINEVRHKYDPSLYVNRAIERELNEFFDNPLDDPERNCFLIMAPAGSGKTNLLCEMARVRVAGQPVLLLMGGNVLLERATGLLGVIQAELQAAPSAVAFHSAGESLHALHRLAGKLDRDALLIIDAINEHDQPVQMLGALRDLWRKTQGRRVKLVVTCRDYYWGLLKGDRDFWERATANGLPAEADEDEGDGFSRFAVDEHERALDLYLDRYKIAGRPVGDAAERCRHPLLLRLFCEAYQGADIGEVEDIRLKDLFDRYWSQKLASIATRMRDDVPILHDELGVQLRDYLLGLGVSAYMLHYNRRAIPLARLSEATGREEPRGDPRTFYARIRDEFIILEETERGKGQYKEPHVAFVYEEFMEYLMARSLIRDWDREGLNEAAILAVVVYLALIMKEQGLELWSLLLDKGEEWQRVVLQTFRKLPEEHLDAGVFDALGEMLATGDEDIQVQVLEVLKLKRVGRAATESVADAVCALAGHEQEAIRCRAVLALRYVGSDERVAPVLAKALLDSRPWARRNAQKALNERGGSVVELAVEPLIPALKGEDLGVKKRAVRALGKLGDAAVEPLIAALKNENGDVRCEAAEVLGKLGDALAAEPLLIAALEDKNRDVRRKAAESLGKLGARRRAWWEEQR